MRKSDTKWFIEFSISGSTFDSITISNLGSITLYNFYVIIIKNLEHHITSLLLIVKVEIEYQEDLKAFITLIISYQSAIKINNF